MGNFGKGASFYLTVFNINCVVATYSENIDNVFILLSLTTVFKN
jgi:hypothetical protein